MQFGQSSEKLDAAIHQLELALEYVEEGTAARTVLERAVMPATPDARQHPVRRSLPDHLPREDVVHWPAGIDGGGRGLAGLARRPARAVPVHRAGRTGGSPLPSDAELASVYGSHSPSRARRLIAYIEERGLIVCHVDFRGQCKLALPTLGIETALGQGSIRTAGMPRGARG